MSVPKPKTYKDEIFNEKSHLLDFYQITHMLDNKRCSHIFIIKNIFFLCCQEVFHTALSGNLNRILDTI